MAFMVSCSVVVWWCWICFVSWYCGICWAVRFFWYWMSRIRFSELQYHVVCWVGTVIQMILLPPSSGQKMLATRFLETSVPLYKTTVCHIQEYHNLSVCHSGNLRSHLGNLLIGWVAMGNLHWTWIVMQLGAYLFQCASYHECKNALDAAMCVRWR